MKFNEKPKNVNKWPRAVDIHEIPNEVYDDVMARYEFLNEYHFMEAIGGGDEAQAITNIYNGLYAGKEKQ